MAKRNFRPVDGGLSAVGLSDGGNLDGTGNGEVDPATIGDGTRSEGSTGTSGASELARDGTGRKKRGPNKASKKASLSVNVSALESMLFSVHLGIASILAAPTMALEQAEARKLAEAAAMVSDHYQIGALGVWGNLAMVAGGIYAPRVIGVVLAKKFGG